MKRNALALALVLVLLGSLTIGVLAQEQVEVVASETVDSGRWLAVQRPKRKRRA